MQETATAKRRSWTLYVVVALLVLGVALLVGLWTTRRPDPMTVKANFKKQLDALGGWSNIEWESREQWNDLVVHAEHGIGDTRYHFSVWVIGSDMVSVTIFRAADYKPNSILLPETHGVFTFKRGSLTKKDTGKLSSDDESRIRPLAEEIAEAARRSL